MSFRTQIENRAGAWIVDYTDQAGERHIETFDRKKDADARHADVRVDVKKGIHVAAKGGLVFPTATGRIVSTPIS